MFLMFYYINPALICVAEFNQPSEYKALATGHNMADIGGYRHHHVISTNGYPFTNDYYSTHTICTDRDQFVAGNNCITSKYHDRQHYLDQQSSCIYPRTTAVYCNRGGKDSSNMAASGPEVDSCNTSGNCDDFRFHCSKMVLSSGERLSPTSSTAHYCSPDSSNVAPLLGPKVLSRAVRSRNATGSGSDFRFNCSQPAVHGDSGRRLLPPTAGAVEIYPWMKETRQNQRRQQNLLAALPCSYQHFITKLYV